MRHRWRNKKMKIKAKEFELPLSLCWHRKEEALALLPILPINAQSRLLVIKRNGNCTKILSFKF